MEESIELIILDIMLPYINGIQALNEIRKTSMIPVLMLTALNDERTQINSFDAMADDDITKPFRWFYWESEYWHCCVA